MSRTNRRTEQRLAGRDLRRAGNWRLDAMDKLIRREHEHEMQHAIAWRTFVTAQEVNSMLKGA